ncbi:hypothetical protein ACG33_12625 [Steroidobacter denitrificans]|uniref:Uncharacterized protein n=1 Tax=Steroidobacter denitrificans TaxID=465721 RepID=A0A127FBZ0_STEDE|nr:hypothetical protein [Steroidobacter denitrificans]AMN47927.1 hypothetical protein ACG33_12625 [Steroidobacter denitrificans]
MNLDELKAAYPDLTFEEVGSDESWDEDASGFCFVIEANIHAKRGRATVMVDDLPRVAFTGNTVGIRKMLVKWDLSRSHLAYLAYELGRAEMAIRHGLPFQQE